MPRALVPLCSDLHTRKGRCTGIIFVDSTPLAVDPNQRVARHQVVGDVPLEASARWAGTLASSCIALASLQGRLMVHDQGELMAFRVSLGEVDDRDPVEQMTDEPGGHLYGDRG